MLSVVEECDLLTYACEHKWADIACIIQLDGLEGRSGGIFRLSCPGVMLVQTS